MKSKYTVESKKFWEPIPGGGAKRVPVGTVIELTERAAKRFGKAVKKVVEAVVEPPAGNENDGGEQVPEGDGALAAAQADRNGQEVIAEVRAETDKAKLEGLRSLEVLNPKREGGRVGVLKAIEERLAELDAPPAE